MIGWQEKRKGSSVLSTAAGPLVYTPDTLTQLAAASKGAPTTSTSFLPLPALFDDEQFAYHLRVSAAALYSALQTGGSPGLEQIAPGLRSIVEDVVLPLLQHWTAGDHADQDAALCRAIGAVARRMLPLLSQGATTVASAAEKEAVLLALLTMESNLEKLELFPQDGHLLINRVDVSLSVNALESVLWRCVAV